MSPNIFNIFLNDLPGILRKHDCHPVNLGRMKLNLLMYADDIILVSRSKAGLQNALNVCYEYFEKWELEVNITKTKVMIFNTNRDVCQFKYRENVLEIVSKYKYLGLVMCRYGSFKLAASELLVKAKKAYGALYQQLNVYNGAKPSILLKLLIK